MDKQTNGFVYTDEDGVKQKVDITSDDFKFVQDKTDIYDIKLQSKPTTFFKDAMKRFTKNKSSVVGGIIIGILAILAFVLPLTLPYDIEDDKTYTSNEQQLPSKLFDIDTQKGATGFWDGTKKYTHITYDTINKEPGGFDNSAVYNCTTTKEGENYTDTVNKYAYGGYMRFWIKATGVGFESTEKVLNSYYYSYNFSNNYSVAFTVNSDEDSSYISAPYEVFLRYYTQDSSFSYTVENKITLKSMSSDYGSFNIDINDAVTATGETINSFIALNKATICFGIYSDDAFNKSVLIKNVIITSSNNNEAAALSVISCSDANASLSISKQDSSGKENKGYWTSTGSINLYKANIIYCNFIYDLYKIAYGDVNNFSIGLSMVQKYVNLGYMSLIDIDPDNPQNLPSSDSIIESFKILDDARCPLRSIDKVNIDTSIPSIVTVNFTGTISQYRYLGYTSMPKYIFGTDSYGKDLFKVVFSGLRTSLILGVVTSAICFAFGLIWGSISGYFGGNVDILMERFCDILGGIPWIVVMTLCIIRLGSSFQTFALALCLTGWMGTSAITRTQFYRFKSREYILASRTLGSSDARLIFRHILPNAMGTIITSSVLMIPGVIFSEAAISYLGLGLQGLHSLGVTLSENQSYLSTNPTLIVVPSIVMALIMISFNLFGNGLRDAFNPSLKGSD